jgi:DNA-binding response OmpR family regulator
MTILLADDDPITLDSLNECLREDGFHTLLARDGREALALWEKHRPDLLCLDVMMPQLDGFDTCRRVRAQDALVPILFLSAKSEEVDIVVGLELGADDFVRKPFGRRELLARIRSGLRRAQARQAKRRSLSFGDLKVWPRELRAERKGKEIQLSPRETSILELLHERTGEVVDRDTLLNRCWGMDYFPESRTLDQHIAKLRKTIGDDAEAQQIIETIRGVGYRYPGKR